jgi:predicted RNA-binding Zn-ribbon protein involved in translation (DUF1610 family)
VKATKETGEQGWVEIPENIISLFKCPDCGNTPLMDRTSYLECSSCKKKWEVRERIYDFREPLK